MRSNDATSSTERAPIRALGDAVISGIAAGEVIQRPASAVKELVENALDAGARAIEIRYDDDTRIDISVSDDGGGIPKDELQLAVERHATSKLRGLDDLEAIGTFGFRGEALASIAAVAELEIVTRTDASAEAAGIRLRRGVLVDRFVAGARVGTRVTLTDLFGDLPARKKFLKAASAEYAAVADVVRRFALLHPAVAYRFIRNGRVALEFPPVFDLTTRLGQVLEAQAAASLHAVDARHAGMLLHGVLSAAGESYGSARRMFLFINGRTVQDRVLFRSVMEGYRTYLMKGRYPAVALFLEIPGQRVDVNVHPAKLEVRFSEPETVQRFVTEAIRETLRTRASPLGRWGLTEAHLLHSEVEATRRHGSITSVAHRPQTGESVAEVAVDIPGYVPAGDSVVDGGGHGTVEGRSTGYVAEQAPLSADLVPALRILGQVFSGYILCERDGELLMIDQHAAHERVLYERLVERLGRGGIERQPLLTPIAVEVGGDGAHAIGVARAELLDAGWDLERLGDEDVVVRAIPALCAGSDARPLVERLAAELGRSDGATAGTALAREVLASVACHAATRVGQKLSVDEQRALIDEIGSVDFAASCPHGRPVARGLTRGRIERMFGR